ncbi:alpha/beta fold hydrolase [Thalassobacillus devorans]|uniref:alpha/beta fold hydrolase n=1 Tax=Thalassobacillus devorans TaxID=279813 RepID=UPI0004B32031|nr:alpha/beta fold hydrolase [Thalassobacillus devorans]
MLSNYTNKNKIVMILVTSIIIGSVSFFIHSIRTGSQDNSKITPTLFVHGFKGGPGSFNTMLNRFESNRLGKKEMVVRVSTEGRLFIRGNFSGSKQPFIQVIFENDRAALHKQTIWLQEIMNKLQTDYGIQQMNMVGHSMGGLASANFLVQGHGTYPTVKKLVVMGSPFLGIDKEEYFEMNTGEALPDLRVDSKALTALRGNKDSFPAHTEVLAIAGVIDGKYTTENADKVVKQKSYDGGDGLVSVSSALGIKQLVKKSNYHQEVFLDASATHSGLHEHPDVDEAITEFLW